MCAAAVWPDSGGVQKLYALHHAYLDDPDFVKEVKDPNKYQTFYVYSAKLGYAVTVVKDDPDHMMLTPIWNFHSYRVDQNGVNEYDWQPCISINAADGSTVWNDWISAPYIQ